MVASASKPFRSTHGYWDSDLLLDSDFAAILATVPALPESGALALRSGLMLVFRSLRSGVDSIDDPSATDAAAWLVDIRRSATGLREKLAGAPRALRKALMKAARRGAHPQRTVDDIVSALGRLADYAEAAEVIAARGQPRGRGGPRKARSDVQQFFDSLLTIYADLHKRHPTAVPAPAWERAGAFPAFTLACVGPAAKHAPALNKYLDGTSRAFEALEGRFREWKRRPASPATDQSSNGN